MQKKFCNLVARNVCININSPHLTGRRLTSEVIVDEKGVRIKKIPRFLYNKLNGTTSFIQYPKLGICGLLLFYRIRHPNLFLNGVGQFG